MEFDWSKSPKRLPKGDQGRAAEALAAIAQSRTVVWNVLESLEEAMGAFARRSLGEREVEYGRLPDVFRDFLACSAFEAQVSNGGLAQAIYNSTGTYLSFLARSYRRFDAEAQAAAIDRLTKLIPGSALATCETRSDWLSEMDTETSAEFSEAELLFMRDGYDFSSHRRLRYAVEHPEHFFEDE